MKFNRYYITNTLGYEAMIHHLFFLWVIKTNCDCAQLNWKKAINLITRMQNVGGDSHHIYPCISWPVLPSQSYHLHFKMDKILK